jgi:hypothetical protein
MAGTYSNERPQLAGMHDSGERQEFDTGAVRDTAGDKPRMELISPFAIRRLGTWLGLGAKKYADRNWEKGIPITRCLASLLRHAEAYLAGDSEEDHMAACMCNAMFILHYEEMLKRGVLSRELDDRPRYEAANRRTGA